METSSRVMAVFNGSGSLGSDCVNAGNEKRSWLSWKAKASAGESVRFHISWSCTVGRR